MNLTYNPVLIIICGMMYMFQLIKGNNLLWKVISFFVKVVIHDMMMLKSEYINKRGETRD